MPRKPASTFVDDNLMVPLANLLPHPTINVRPLDLEAVKAKERSIRKAGLVSSLTAVAGEDGTYLVIAGKTRLAALNRIAEWKRRAVPVRVVAADESMNLAQAMVENIEHQPLSALEECDAFTALRLAGKTEAEIGAIFGMSPKVVGQRLQLSKLIPTCRGWLQSGLITVTSAGRLAARAQAEQERLAGVIEGMAQHAYGRDKGLVADWMVGRALENADEIDAKHALFDVEASGIAFTRDLFAPNNSPGVITDPARFLELQRESLGTRLAELAQAIGAAETMVIDCPAGDQTAAYNVGTYIHPKRLPSSAGAAEDEEEDEAEPEEEMQDWERRQLEEEERRLDRVLIATLHKDGRVSFDQRGKLKAAELEAAQAERVGGEVREMSQSQQAAVAEVQALIAAGHVMTDPLLALRTAIVMLARTSDRSFDRSLANIVADHHSPAAGYVRDAWQKLAALGGVPLDSTDRRAMGCLHDMIGEVRLMAALQELGLDELLPILQAAVVQALHPAGGRSINNRPRLIRDVVGPEADGRHYRMDEYELRKFKAADLQAALTATPTLDAKPGKTRKATIAAIVARGEALQTEHGTAPVFALFVEQPKAERDLDEEDEPGEDEPANADEGEDPGAAFRDSAAA